MTKASDVKPPCATVAATAGVSGGIFGVMWGFYSGISDPREFSPLFRVAHVTGSALGDGLKFGVLAALFSGTRCASQRLRGQDDWVNSSVAGAIAGTAVAATVGQRGWTLLQAAALAAIVAGAADRYLIGPVGGSRGGGCPTAGGERERSKWGFKANRFSRNGQF
ncbi:hypothetical protein CLOM_g18129 [Closterium sp. NIES-68]|nr:hypothetical protein CLOM_g18129 [Closterium sp. NIES-68]